MITVEKIIDPVVGLIVTTISGLAATFLYKRIRKNKFIRKTLLKNKIPANYNYSISKNDLARINEIYSGQVIISGPYQKEPKINCHGELDDINESVKIKSQEYKSTFSERNTPNDLHAVIFKEISKKGDPLHVETKIADYSIVKALRDEKPLNQWPKILSASALVVDKTNERIILHRRSDKSATYKEHLHTIGGAYWPSTKERDGDKKSIRNTVYREVLEEINTPIAINKSTPLFLIEEISTGFIQFLYIGCNAYETDRLQGNAEGNNTDFSIDEIEDLLNGNEKIVPSGEAAIFLWLAMGALGLDEESYFSGDYSKEIFKRISFERKTKNQKTDSPV